MVFCGNCGAQNEDGAAFCAECGAQLTAESQQPQPEPRPEPRPEPQQPQPDSQQSGFRPTPIPTPSGKPETGKKSKLPLIIIAAAAVVVVILVLVLALGGKGYESTAVSAVEAIFKPNTEIIFTKYTPKKVLAEFLDQGDLDMDDVRDECEDLDDEITDAKEELEDDLDEKLKFSYEARKSKDLSNRDLKDLKEKYDDDFGVKISAAKKVTVRVTVKAGREKEHFDVSDITVIKVGGKWYLELESFARSMTYIDNNLYNLF